MAIAHICHCLDGQGIEHVHLPDAKPMPRPPTSIRRCYVCGKHTDNVGVFPETATSASVVMCDDCIPGSSWKRGE